MEEGIMYGISVFVGIIAGIGVTIGVDFIKSKRQGAHDKNNLSFELRCNLAKIEKWLEMIIELRNYINSDRIDQYNSYFGFSSTIFITANRLFQDGKLYEYLSYDSIEKLQENAIYLSYSGENMINNQIMQHKQAKMSGYNNVKQSAASNIDFWDKTLKMCKNNFDDILRELQ